jgi:hypothetical protein
MSDSPAIALYPHPLVKPGNLHGSMDDRNTRAGLRRLRRGACRNGCADDADGYEDEDERAA